MALQSMTGFGRGESANDNFTVTAEIKSVNHRFKDIRFKMSSLYNSLELGFKKELTEKFKRGSFDIYINFKRAESKSRFDEMDENKVDQYLQKISAISKKANMEMNVQPTEFLRSEFMKDVDLSKDEALMKLTKDAFSKALVSLETSRESEGEKMIAVIAEHKDIYYKNFKIIEGQTEHFQNNVEEKLKKKMAELSSEVTIDEPRFLQEVVYYLEKMDVDEEINRIHAHIAKLDDLLKVESEVGRQIDFLIQELNRETNTIGSKSTLKEISDNVVQMKVQLEKIREQGLNLE